MEDEVEVVFQVNGKVRAKSNVPRDLGKEIDGILSWILFSGTIVEIH